MFKNLKKPDIHVLSIGNGQSVLQQLGARGVVELGGKRIVELQMQWNLQVPKFPTEGCEVWMRLLMSVAEVQFDRHTQPYAGRVDDKKFWISLRKLFNRAVIYCMGDRASFLAMVLWIQARLLMHTWPQDQIFSLWQTRLSGLGLSLEMYTAEWGQAACGVYLMIAPGSRHTYIGSTECTVAGRYSTRLRKLRQLQNGKFVECEVAIRFWKATKSFSNFVPILIAREKTKEAALVKEALLQQEFQPSLCMPWILHHFHSAGSKLVKPTFQRTGMRMFKRFRHQHVGTEPIQDCVDKHKVAWQQLHKLGGNHFSRFQTSRRLRQAHIDTKYLYYLFRLAPRLDEPFRSRSIRELGKIIKAHSCKVPQNPRPLLVAVLDHPQFKTNLKSWLVQWTKRHQSYWLPLHWPSTSIIEGGQRTIAQSLHNWRLLMKTWTLQPPTVCHCEEILSKFPDLPVVESHIAGQFCSTHLPPHLQFLAATSTKDGCYLPKTKYLLHFQQQLRKWIGTQADEVLLHNLLQEAEQFLDSQWPDHLESVLVNDKFQAGDICKLKQLFPECVFHCEDHLPHCLCIYCPLVYFRLLKKTYADEAVFKEIMLTPALLRSTMGNRIPKNLKRRYPWGFKENSELANAYILPKKKKRFTTARPIIASHNTMCGPLFKAFAKIMMNILPVVYPLTFGNGTMGEIVADLHRFLSLTSEQQTASEYVMLNDDLKGFFTSVPADRILGAILHLTQHYQETNPDRRGNKAICFTVPQKIMSKTRIIRGKSFTKSTKNRILYLSDFVEIAKLAIEQSFFVCMDSVYSQSRGAIIGGHASPVLCAAAVAYEEFIWIRAYGLVKKSIHITEAGIPPLFCIRYVDNRLTLVQRDVQCQWSIARFIRQDFYKSPVELEDCGDDKFLGFRLNVMESKMTFVVPEDGYAYRNVRSAGTIQKILSGLQARLHLIHRGTFPKSDISSSVNQLLQGYEKQGFDIKVLRRIAFRTAGKFRTKK